ncbi:SAVED domain-containing protein [uncultured Parasutterella sp.]|uniref:SAVED domain-containing protein n=1 Tax=uncultured Parasutterella sp. TaxID=1263098 RepID=UPI0025B6599E|nr:SAVED domain-containing protein [uncultured Parasutterella sp.]
MPRGKRPSKDTEIRLWAVTAGICEFPGCGKNLLEEALTQSKLKTAQMAHIIASSENGTRGCEESHRFSSEFDNLILLCPEHHRLIDNEPEKYPVEELHRMKDQHREKVAELRKAFELPAASVICFVSPINSMNECRIDPLKARGSIYPLYTYDGLPKTLNVTVDSKVLFGSSLYWSEAKKKTYEEYKNVTPYLDERKNLAVFALAPIPLLVYFGSLLGDKYPIKVFPVGRAEYGWQNNGSSVEFMVEEFDGNDPDSSSALLIVNITGKVNWQRIQQQVGKVVVITANRVGKDVLMTLKSLGDFDSKYTEALEKLKSFNLIYIAAAAPSHIGVEMGRRLLKIHPKLHVLQGDNGRYHETFDIEN